MIVIMGFASFFLESYVISASGTDEVTGRFVDRLVGSEIAGGEVPDYGTKAVKLMR